MVERTGDKYKGQGETNIAVRDVTMSQTHTSMRVLFVMSTAVWTSVWTKVAQSGSVQDFRFPLDQARVIMTEW